MIYTSIFNFFIRNFWYFKFLYYLCSRFRRNSDGKQHAQMAESVDALVSNTSGATRAGSTPALGTLSTTFGLSRRAGFLKGKVL